jgi:excisionase family DNA binding protein
VSAEAATVEVLLEAVRRQTDALERVEAAVRELTTFLRQDHAAADRPSDGEWLTAAQAAERLGMTTKALYSAVEAGGPLASAASRLGRRLRFHREGLDRLLLHRRSAPRTIPRACPVAPKEERW